MKESTDKEKSMDNEETNETPDVTKTEKFVAGAITAGVVAFALEPLIEKSVRALKTFLKNR